MEKDKKAKNNWKKKLSPEAYNVLRGKGTEMPFQNKYFDKFINNYYAYQKNCLNLIFQNIF